MKIRYSEINTFLRCRYLWHLAYVRRITLRLERPSISLGSAVHEGLASGLRGGVLERGIEEWADTTRARLDVLGGAFDDETALLESVKEQALVIARRAFANLDIGHRFATAEHEGKPLVEVGFDRPLPGLRRVRLQGHVDWVAIDLETGFWWLVDHKTRKAFLAEDLEQYNAQMVVYNRLLREMGIVTHGSMAHQIKSVVPTEPKVNKDGSLSRALITCDWPTYLAAIQRQGLNPADYEDMKEKLSTVEWVRMSKAYWKPEIVDRLFDTFAEPARYFSYKRKQIVRSISSMNCKSCRLAELCWAELRGEDTDFLLKTRYCRDGENNTALPIFSDDEEE